MCIYMFVNRHFHKYFVMCDKIDIRDISQLFFSIYIFLAIINISLKEYLFCISVFSKILQYLTIIKVVS